MLRCCEWLPFEEIFALPAATLLSLVHLTAIVLITGGDSAFRSSRLIFLTSCTVLLSLLFPKPLFHIVSFDSFSPRTPCLETSFSAVLSYHYTFSKIRFSWVLSFAFHFYDISFASELKERMGLMNRNVFEWEFFLFAETWCQWTAQVSKTSLGLVPSHNRAAHQGSWRRMCKRSFRVEGILVVIFAKFLSGLNH